MAPSFTYNRIMEYLSKYKLIQLLSILNIKKALMLCIKAFPSSHSGEKVKLKYNCCRPIKT